MKRKLEICKCCKMFATSKHNRNFKTSEALVEFACKKQEDYLSPSNAVRFPDIRIASYTPWFFYTKEEFESFGIVDKCELYAEYCMEEWNEDEKKA